MSDPLVIMDVEKFLAGQQAIVEKNIAKAYELGRAEERERILTALVGIGFLCIASEHQRGFEDGVKKCIAIVVEVKP